MNNLENIQEWITENITKVLQCYINERKEKGEGLLLVVSNIKNDNIHLLYKTFNEVDKKIVDDINKLNYTNSKAYMLCFDIETPNENILVEKELDININNNTKN